MPATFTIPLITVIPGQTLTAALWNNEYGNIYDNFIPAGMDDYSTNDAQMQTATDPFPSGSTSRPTSLQGEIERLRFQFANILGESYWYNDPDATIAAITARVVVLEGALTAPAGTKMVFYQAAAPTGWTAVAVNDKFLRVVTAGGTGGSSGGSGLAPSSTITLAHSHTVSSHTHDLGNHTHSTPAHTHTLVNSTLSGVAGGTGSSTQNVEVASAGGRFATYSWSGGGTHTERPVSATTNSGEGTGTSGTPSTNTSGATAPGTDSQLTDIAFQYADVIVATKN